MTSVGDPLLGQVLDGRYEIVQRLARGGMATVYQALDIRLTRMVAVKVMHVGLGDDAQFARKFDREARAAAQLSHPNVVSVFDQGHDDPSGRDGGRPYIVMEYVAGHTLRDVIRREAPLTPLRALEIIEPVLNALSCAHDAGLVHRDVKPENVLISDRGQIKVADFGLAKAISAQTSTATQGLLIGTVSYLPPELVVSGRADARSDVYSAGVVLFELLTGQKPHTGETPIQVAYAHVHTDVPPPSSYVTAGPVPPYLDALISRVTARDPQVRPPDAKVMLTLVRRVRAALRDGVGDDAELTQDLTLPSRAGSTAGRPLDPADSEATQFVPVAIDTRPNQQTIPQRLRDHDQVDTGSVERDSWPTVLDAPPPAVARPRSVPLDPQAAHRHRSARNRRRGWLALLLVLILATTAALAGWYYTDGRYTTAPTLETLSQPQAESVARDAGLDLVLQPEFSESVGRGVVIATSPGPGEKVVTGGQVTARVSKGPERHPVPTVVGLPQSQAEQAVRRGSLTVGKVSQAYSETVATGLVISASPAPGAALKRAAEVKLTISAGPKPIPVPNFEKKSAVRAKSALTEAGFKVEVSTSHSATVDKGRVISQRPNSGVGRRGDEVALEKSLGPVMVTVPKVSRGMGVGAASDLVRAAGFRVRTRPVSVNYLGLGYVAYTRPGSGSKAPEHSTITLYLV
ncbi:MAG TPA: Stk1 family PASTA domain-containing Ser/Thr kinase [Propionibacteriaceae bacterium]|nr:Stk1 family PASTA domain-containing Ser/Thr kinase [Propionibacteriaceae bacterium]